MIIVHFILNCLSRMTYDGFGPRLHSLIHVLYLSISFTAFVFYITDIFIEIILNWHTSEPKSIADVAFTWVMILFSLWEVC